MSSTTRLGQLAADKNKFSAGFSKSLYLIYGRHDRQLLCLGKQFPETTGLLDTVRTHQGSRRISVLANNGGNLPVVTLTLFFQIEKKINVSTAKLGHFNQRRNAFSPIFFIKMRTGIQTLELSQGQ